MFDNQRRRRHYSLPHEHISGTETENEDTKLFSDEPDPLKAYEAKEAWHKLLAAAQQRGTIQSDDNLTNVQKAIIARAEGEEWNQIDETLGLSSGTSRKIVGRFIKWYGKQQSIDAPPSVSR